MYCPTPEEIAEACAAIQATWSPVEELRRRVGRCPVRIHRIRLGDLHSEANCHARTILARDYE
jgi:hypothetical protein